MLVDDVVRELRYRINDDAPLVAVVLVVEEEGCTLVVELLVVVVLVEIEEGSRLLVEVLVELELLLLDVTILPIQPCASVGPCHCHRVYSVLSPRSRSTSLARLTFHEMPSHPLVTMDKPVLVPVPLGPVELSRFPVTENSATAFKLGTSFKSTDFPHLPNFVLACFVL